MPRQVAPFVWVMLLVLTSCGMDRRVGEGLVQKRRYTRGWHVDLHRPARAERGTPSTVEHPVLGAIPVEVTASAAAVPPPLHTEEPRPDRSGTVMAQRPEAVRQERAARTVAGRNMGGTVVEGPKAADAMEDAPEEKEKLEPLAGLSLLALVLSVVLGMALGSPPIFIALAVLAFFLAIAALVNNKDRKRKGRGLAIITLFLLAALVFFGLLFAGSSSMHITI